MAYKQGGDKYNPRHKTKRRATRGNYQSYQYNDYSQQRRRGRQNADNYYDDYNGRYSNNGYEQPRSRPPLIAQKRTRHKNVRDSFEDEEVMRKKEEDEWLREKQRKRSEEQLEVKQRRKKEDEYRQKSKQIRNKGDRVDDGYSRNAQNERR